MHFYATVTGRGKTASTRGGTKKTGLNAHVRGWDIGAYVELSHEDGRDIVRVYQTGGSNDDKETKLIAEFANG